MIYVDDALPEPLHRQVYECIRTGILRGRLQPGQRLPATRRLAERLGLARNTIARAYDDLLSEGYLEGRTGSGTFVARAFAESQELAAHESVGDSIADDSGEANSSPRWDVIEQSNSPTLSNWARRAFAGASLGPLDLPRTLPFDFRPGTPDWDAFPRQIWWRLLGRRLRAGKALQHYGDPAGYPPLREAIASHITASRAVVCRPDQVVIVNGTQQAVDLLARLLVEPGDSVLVEDPGYPDARRTFAAYGANLLPVPVDNLGICTDQLPDVSRPRIIYVTPSHQFPTGVTLSLERRLQLLTWAERRGALILEDDYDSEFRYAGRPVESLQGLDRTGSVIYLGTFSTILFPPLRVGYLVLPPALVAPFIRAKWLADRGTSTLEQQALADFLQEGHFARHLRRVRRLGRERRDALLVAVKRYLGSEADVPSADTGMHALMQIPGRDDREVAAAAANRGVGVYSTRGCFMRESETRPALILGYGSLTPQAIDEGIRRLHLALRDRL